MVPRVRWVSLEHILKVVDTIMIRVLCNGEFIQKGEREESGWSSKDRLGGVGYKIKLRSVEKV